MSSIAFAPALNPALFDTDVMAKTIKVTSGLWTSLQDVCGVLSTVGIPPDQVSALQKGRNDGDGVTVVLKRTEDIDRLRSVEYHVHNHKKFYISHIDSQHIFVRLHWLPVYVTEWCVKHIMASYGKVLEVENAYSFHGKDNTKISTGVKIVKMEVTECQRLGIPHIIKFECGNSVLITGGGRPPMCLKCSRVGHMRRDCPTARPGQSSYARVAAAKPDKNNDSVRISEQHVRGEPVDTVEEVETQADLVIDEERNEKEEETGDMEVDSRGKKRGSEVQDDTFSDSFNKAFPAQKPRKSRRPSVVSPAPVTTQNIFSVLAGESLDLEVGDSLDGAEVISVAIDDLVDN